VSNTVLLGTDGLDLTDVVKTNTNWHRAADACSRPHYAFSPSMNWRQCAGNGRIENGVCVCDQGWGGTECDLCGVVSFRYGTPCRPREDWDTLCRTRNEKECPLECSDPNYEFRDCFENEEAMRTPTHLPDRECVSKILLSDFDLLYYQCF